MVNKLEIDGLKVSFKGRDVLSDVYLQNQTGKITGILGRNGSGKSTLLNVLSGHTKNEDASIRINGEWINPTKDIHESIRYLPQVNFVPRKRKLTLVFEDFQLNIEEFCSTFREFKDKIKKDSTTFSGGELRLLETYLILKSDTQFCLLDEPFSQIMPLHIERIKSLIQEEKKSKGIIITDHLYEHIIDLSDDLYVISNNKVHLTKDENDLIRLGYLLR